MKDDEKEKIKLQEKTKRSFLEFMGERRAVDRWFVVKVALAGAFMGALITVGFMTASVGVWFSF